MQNNESYPTIKDCVMQEAYEKGFEILVMALKDYEQEKDKIITEKKEILHAEFDKIQKENTAIKRIHRSSLINGSRMNKMKSRHTYPFFDAETY